MAVPVWAELTNAVVSKVGRDDEVGDAIDVITDASVVAWEIDSERDGQRLVSGSLLLKMRMTEKGRAVALRRQSVLPYHSRNSQRSPLPCFDCPLVSLWARRPRCLWQRCRLRRPKPCPQAKTRPTWSSLRFPKSPPTERQSARQCSR